MAEVQHIRGHWVRRLIALRTEEAPPAMRAGPLATPVLAVREQGEVLAYLLGLRLADLEFLADTPHTRHRPSDEVVGEQLGRLMAVTVE